MKRKDYLGEYSKYSHNKTKGMYGIGADWVPVSKYLKGFSVAFENAVRTGTGYFGIDWADEADVVAIATITDEYRLGAVTSARDSKFLNDYQTYCVQSTERVRGED